MAIEKRISLTLETGDAKKRIKELQDAIAGVDKKLPKKGSDPVAPITDSYKKGRKTILDYSGTLSNSDRIVKQSAGTYSLAEKQLLKHDTAIRKLNKAYQEGRINVAQYEDALQQANAVNVQATKEAKALDARLGNTSGIRVMRGSLSQLSYQLQDIAVQAQMGTNWFTIIGQQGPQIASLLGPLGAVLGVVIAVGAAVGGVALASFLDLTDASEELGKKMDDLDGMFEKTRSGSLRLSDSFYELKRSSESAGRLQEAITRVTASNALYDLERSVKQSTDSISQSFFGLIDDIDIKKYEESLKILNAATNRELSLVSDNMFAYTPGAAGRFGILAEAKSVVDSTLEDMSESLGITTEGAERLTNAIQKIDFGKLADPSVDLKDVDTAQIRSSFDNLESIVADLFKTIEDGDKRKVFLEFAKQMRDAGNQGRDLSNQIDAVNKNVVTPRVSFAKAFDDGVESSARLNSEYNTTSSLISSINSEYERLNELQLNDDNVENADAYNQAKLNSIQIIADEISALDDYKDRQKVIKDLLEETSVLREEDGKAALALAQEQNFAYEQQTTSLATLIKDSKTLSDIYNQGAKDYVESVGSYNESLQGLVSNAFSSMEDAIVSFAETGKLSFSDFARSILSDLLRIQIQQQLAGLAGSISGAIGGAVGSPDGISGQSSGVLAGGVASGGAKGFARGGITGMANTIQSTPKYFANGGGLLGESAQSEAILPLTRTSGGDLGVKTSGGMGQTAPVYVNITNEAGVSGEVTSQTQNADGSVTIDVVAKMVNQVISSGRSDKSLQNRFGIKRQGA